MNGPQREGTVRNREGTVNPDRLDRPIRTRWRIDSASSLSVIYGHGKNPESGRSDRGRPDAEGVEALSGLADQEGRPC